jgi:GT2 family glycosyltransferase
MQPSDRQPTFTVCICTRNRPDELRHAIRSAQASTYPVHQIVVSDDSTDTETGRMIHAEFPDIDYVLGGRRGLAANRNTALGVVTGTHVLFIDDDARLAPDFFDRVWRCLQDGPDRFDRLIVTGTEINNGRKVLPHALNFLGFMNVQYGRTDTIYTIVINATVFPRPVFASVNFDESLTYGYEEVDFSSRAVFRGGFEIVLLPDASNYHMPSPINRDYYEPFVEASRIYVVFKKYWWTDRRPLKAAWFLMVAYPHNLAFNLKARGLRGLSSFLTTLRKSVGYLRTCFAAPLKFT